MERWRVVNYYFKRASGDVLEPGTIFEAPESEIEGQEYKVVRLTALQDHVAPPAPPPPPLTVEPESEAENGAEGEADEPGDPTPFRRRRRGRPPRRRVFFESAPTDRAMK